MTRDGSPMGCTEAVERLWGLLDEELDEVDRAALDRHLSWCLRCCGELAFAEELRAMLRQRSGAPLPGDVHQRLESFVDQLFEPSGEAT